MSLPDPGATEGSARSSVQIGFLFFGFWTIVDG